MAGDALDVEVMGAGAMGSDVPDDDVPALGASA
jgi:hypothetical protein